MPGLYTQVVLTAPALAIVRHRSGGDDVAQVWVVDNEGHVWPFGKGSKQVPQEVTKVAAQMRESA